MSDKSVFERDFFELFGLPRQFFVDEAMLDEGYHRLLSRFHPDRFVSAGQQEKRLAVQISAHLNHAASVLRDSAKRAQYCLEVCEVEVDVRGVTVPQSFLMEQLEWREKLDSWLDRRDCLNERELADIRAFYLLVTTRYHKVQVRLAELVDPCLQDHNHCDHVVRHGRDVLGELQFLKKTLSLMEANFDCS